MIYTVTLNPALDLTTGSAGRRLDPGGKGLNTAKTLLALGIPSVAVLLSAGARGEELCQLAWAQGLTLAPIPAAGETRVNEKCFDGGVVIERNQPGPAFDPTAFRALQDWLAAHLQPGDALALCGSLPPGAPADCYARLAAGATGCRVVVDGSGPALAAALAARPWAVKPNLAELEALAGQSLPDTAARLDAARALCNQGAQRVLLSLGPEGALLVAPEGVWLAEAPAVPVRGTVGAGDAMTALLTCAPPEDAPGLLTACVAAGSAAVLQPGSAPLRRDDWLRLRAQIRPRPLA